MRVFFSFMDSFIDSHALCRCLVRVTKQKCTDGVGAFLLGDPYGNRTHVTAVKGRCLSRLTNGPGSGDWT